MSRRQRGLGVAARNAGQGILRNRKDNRDDGESEGDAGDNALSRMIAEIFCNTEA